MMKENYEIVIKVIEINEEWGKEIVKCKDGTFAIRDTAQKTLHTRALSVEDLKELFIKDQFADGRGDQRIKDSDYLRCKDCGDYAVRYSHLEEDKPLCWDCYVKEPCVNYEIKGGD